MPAGATRGAARARRAVAGGCRPGAPRRPRWRTTCAAFSTGANVHAHGRRSRPSAGDSSTTRIVTGCELRQRSTPVRATCSRDCSKALDAPAPPALYAGAIPIPAQLPGFVRDNALDAPRARQSRPKIWLGNRVTVADSLRHVVQRGLRGGGPAALHAVSARPAREHVRRAARIHARGSARQHGETGGAGFREVSRASPTRWPRRSSPTSSPATRCSFRTCGGTTSSRATRSTCWSTTGGTTCPPGRARPSWR